MRIGMILSTPLPPCEGIGFYAWNLARFLTETGHTVHLATRGSAGKAQVYSSEGITVWKLPFFPVYPLHVHLHGLFVNRWLKCMEGGLDLLHLHSPLVPVPDTNLPLFVTVHTPLKADTRASRSKSLIGWLIRMQAPFSLMLEEKLFTRSDRLVGTAKSVAYELAEYNISPSSVGILGNGVDTKIFHPAVHKAKKITYVLSAARLAPRKGIEDLILAAEQILQQSPSIRFLIAGSGPLEKEIETLIRKKGIEKAITLPGHIHDRSHMVAAYQNCSVFVHPAHYEGLPTVLLEAMACGCAVVATAVSGALDVITPGVNGLLVPPRCPSALAEAVLQILEDPGLAARLGQAARRTVEERYSWQVVGRRYLEEYTALLKARRVDGG